MVALSAGCNFYLRPISSSRAAAAAGFCTHVCASRPVENIKRAFSAVQICKFLFLFHFFFFKIQLLEISFELNETTAAKKVGSGFCTHVCASQPVENIKRAFLPPLHICKFLLSLAFLYFGGGGGTDQTIISFFPQWEF